MKYIRNTTDFYIEENTVLSLGKFDGIHRGHEQLLQYFAKKKDEGLAGAIFTFDIPPRRNVHVKCMVVGEDFHFGHNRRGDYHMLRQYAGKYGYEVIVVEKIKEDSRDISSTFVREEIAAGNIEKANHLLGYRYFVTSRVLHGNQIGRTIGIPTINQLPPKEKLLPPNGVYVTEAYIGDRWYRGISNVGCKPTIEGEYPVGVETHLLDFAEDVYDKMVTVEFLSRVRSERKFASIEALKEQMQNDVAYGRAYFEKHTS